MLRWIQKWPFFAGWLSGLLTVAMVGGVVGLSVLLGFVYEIGASTPHSKLVAWVIHSTMINSVQRSAPDSTPPPPVNRTILLAGAAEYDAHCIVCHGGPGIDRAPWVSAMLPTPPFLIDSSHRWTHAQLTKIIRDGVKMTGMPAWGEVDSPQQIAAVVAFVEAMPRLRPAQFAQLREAIRAQPVPSR